MCCAGCPTLPPTVKLIWEQWAELRAKSAARITSHQRRKQPLLPSALAAHLLSLLWQKDQDTLRIILQRHLTMSFCQFLGGEIYKDHFKPGEQLTVIQAAVLWCNLPLVWIMEDNISILFVFGTLLVRIKHLLKYKYWIMSYCGCRGQTCRDKGNRADG